MRPVLGIDPGTHKCGWAFVVAAGEPPIALGIAPLAELGATIESFAREHSPRAIALGRGTNAATVEAILAATTRVPVTLVDERETTLRARARYFAAHPPRGWRRLVPRGMLLPPRPIDDYAAVLIAERWLAEETPAP